jgi:hypothetical protein
MNHLRKLARVFAFLSIYMLTPAWAETQTPNATMAGTAVAMTDIAKADPGGQSDGMKRGERLLAEAGPMPWGHGGQFGRCERPGGGPGPRFGGDGPPPPPAHFGPDRLAIMLSGIETEIGIRANQLDAWRNFTDSLLAVMARPMPPFADKAPDAGSQPPAQEPFAIAKRIADNAVERGHHAEDLLKAIDALKKTLTPEQLAKVTEIEAKLAALRGGPHRFGPPPHGWEHGPGHGPGPDSGPGPDGPGDGQEPSHE